MGSYMGAQMRQQGYRAWSSGKVIPHRITAALDAKALQGPEVDLACGVEEPAVDQWEAGTLYPTWEQLCALADLCGVQVWLFTMEPFEFPLRTSLRFHKIGGKSCDWLESPPVRMFTPEAIAVANLPKSPTPPTNPTPRPPTGRRRLRGVA